MRFEPGRRAAPSGRDPGRVLPAVLLCLACALLATGGRAATIVVDTNLDAGDGNCTLREAIEAANTDLAVDGCAAGSGDDVIDLTGLSGTLSLEAGGLLLTSNVTIEGPGARDLRISGAALTPRTQMIRNDNDAIVEIRDVTIADKAGESLFAGCLIPCGGELLLDRVRVTNCTAAPDVDLGDGAGAALSTNCVNSHVTIRDSLFDDNHVTGAGARGGAIWWAGVTLTLTNTTLSGNSSGGRGGAIWSSPNAGVGGATILQNVTFAANEAGEAGAAIDFAGGSTGFQNTVVALSTAGGNCAFSGGIRLTAGYNLDDDGSCTFDGTGDRLSVASGLGPLADHGGPTDTHLPDPGSPLIDAGNPTGCIEPDGAPLEADQRGVPRPQGPACDIGSVEVEGGCTAAPRTDCLAATKSQLQWKIDDDGSPEKNRVKWSWKKGATFDESALGDPTATTGYALCVYDGVDGTPALAAAPEIGPSPAWASKGAKGWTYKDKGGAEDGIVKASLKPAAPGKSKVQVQGRGATLPVPTPDDASELFDQDPSVLVQLVNDDGTCWTSEFAPEGTKKNEPDEFRATAR